MHAFLKSKLFENTFNISVLVPYLILSSWGKLFLIIVSRLSTLVSLWYNVEGHHIDDYVDSKVF